MERSIGIYVNVIKPFLDRLVALMCLVLASPLFITLIIILAIVQKGRVFYNHDRPGYLGEPFKFYKFSTLKEKTDATGRILTEKERLGPMGFFMRKSSLDELPQLINILKGDMSFVGPRPLLMEYLPLYSQRQRRRHDVKPGLTGYAQINGRNLLDWDRRFAYDLHYVQNISFGLDIRILLKTVRLVLSGKGVSGASSVLMENFQGNADQDD